MIVVRRDDFIVQDISRSPMPIDGDVLTAILLVVKSPIFTHVAAKYAKNYTLVYDLGRRNDPSANEFERISIVCGHLVVIRRMIRVMITTMVAA